MCSRFTHLYTWRERPALRELPSMLTAKLKVHPVRRAIHAVAHDGSPPIGPISPPLTQGPTRTERSLWAL